MPPTEYGAPLQIQEVKSAPGDTWEVAGYASTFGNTDLGGDVVQPGAFDASLASGRKVRFLYGHDPRQVLGSAAELKTDERGLFGRFRISPTQLGRDVHQLLKDGALDSFSIGYVPTEFEYAESKGKSDPEVRLLKAVDLLECSVVAMPMNPAALVTAVKAEDAALLPFDALWQRITESLKTGATEAKALAARRGAEQRKLSDRSLDALRAGMAEAEALLAEMRELIASQAAVVTPAQAKAAMGGGLALRLELARRRLRQHGLIDEHGEIVP